MTLTPEYLADLEEADSVICNAMAESYPTNWDATDIERHKADIGKLIDASRKLTAIAPLLMEVIEARGRAWPKIFFEEDCQHLMLLADDGQTTRSIPPDPLYEMVAHGRLGTTEAETIRFIETAANNITKIEKVLRDG